MSRRAANERRAASAVPLHMASDNRQVRSTDSQESIKTQVPLPYHLPETYVQNNGYFETPELASQGTFESFNSAADGRSNSMSLNPNSAPYFPPPTLNYPPVPIDNGYGGPRPSMSMYPIPEQNQYYGANSYNQGGPVGSPEMGSAQFQPPYGAPLAGPYGDYAGNPYQPQDHAMYHQIPLQYQQGAGITSPTMSNSSAYSYAIPPNDSYTTMSYGPPQGGRNSISYPPTHGYVPQGRSQSAGWSQEYNQYGGPQAQPAYVLPSNINRGKPAVKYPRERQNNNRAATYGSGSGANIKHKGGQSYYGGGPVLPPARSPSKGRNGRESPTKNMKAAQALAAKALAEASQTSSSHEYQSQSSSQPASQTLSQVASEDEPKSEYDVGSPTPAAKVRNKVEFASETRQPRHSQTPTLRSRRGQSIAGAATDPARKTTEWLEKIQDRAPPPKMMDILENALSGGSHEVSKLGRINENDPFTGPPRSTRRGTVAAPLLDNPFGPHQLVVRAGANNSNMSGNLRALTDGGRMKPTVDQALDTRNLPFVEYCRNAKVDQWGVVKIRNIPYSCNRPEVLAFLGRNARIISEQDYEPVHIVMERVTSKTLDCFVEFINFGEAVAAVQRFEQNRTGGRGGRLGQRHVEMELSSQSQLMYELFPKAKNVEWRNEGQLPIVHDTDPNDKYNSGFQGFLSKEELVMLTKHVECPQRSPFSKECPQRPFECLISTLLKYPWYMVDYITIEDRDLLFEATIKLLELLRDRLDGTRDSNTEMDINITPMLYKRCWRAALKCPGFSPTMKDEVVFKLHIDEMIAQEMGVPMFAADYKYLWTIGNKPGMPHDMMLWYAAIIREHTSKKERLSLAEKAAKGEGDQTEKLFGDLHKYFGHPKDTKVFKHLTLAQVAVNEWAGFETVLREALTPALEA